MRSRTIALDYLHWHVAWSSASVPGKCRMLVHSLSPDYSIRVDGGQSSTWLHHTVKPLRNNRDISTQPIYRKNVGRNMLRARLTMLRHAVGFWGAKVWKGSNFNQELTQLTQHAITGWPNVHNVLYAAPHDDASKCCDRWSWLISQTNKNRFPLGSKIWNSDVR